MIFGKSESCMSDYNPIIEGNVFDIQDFAVADGPGIRTVVFMKQCPLRCDWCSNPESQNSEKQILYYRKLCADCGKCIEICPKNAIMTDQRFGLLTIRDKCTGCGICEQHCFYDARKLIGKQVSVASLLQTVLKNSAFYSNSEGGVTISGGEPFCQAEFVTEFLKALKKSNVHSAVETSGFTDWKNMEMVLPYIDTFFYDIKHVDEQIHIRAAGVSNKIILENLNRLVKLYRGELVVRIPFIPGFNGDEESQRQIFSYLHPYSGKIRIEIVPYHRFGKLKYDGLGLIYKYAELEPVKKTNLLYLIDIGNEYGLNVTVS